jgi:hypothetical protein
MRYTFSLHYMKIELVTNPDDDKTQRSITAPAKVRWHLHLFTQKVKLGKWTPIHCFVNIFYILVTVFILAFLQSEKKIGHGKFRLIFRKILNCTPLRENFL